MAPRANWKGYLKLSLVSCAVALYPGDQFVRPRPLPYAQSRDRQPGQAPVHRSRDGRAGRGRRAGQRLRGRQGLLHLRRGRGTRGDPDREHPHDRHRELRAARSGRRALPRGAVLHRTRTTRSPRRRSPSSATPCARRARRVLPAWSSPAASAWCCSSRSARAFSRRCCATPMRCAARRPTSRTFPT